MIKRNFAKERKLVNDWSYLKPSGPHQDDNETERLRKNLMEMEPADLKALIEAGDEMQEYIRHMGEP